MRIGLVVSFIKYLFCTFLLINAYGVTSTFVFFVQLYLVGP
jgi:hypothetical protein